MHRNKRREFERKAQRSNAAADAEIVLAGMRRFGGLMRARKEARPGL
jgi:hypothetical protein